MHVEVGHCPLWWRVKHYQSKKKEGARRQNDAGSVSLEQRTKNGEYDSVSA